MFCALMRICVPVLHEAGDLSRPTELGVWGTFACVIMHYLVIKWHLCIGLVWVKGRILWFKLFFFPNFVSTYLLLTEANYRMALDDNHDSVVLSCAKVINVMLSFEFNESYFESSEVTLFLFFVWVYFHYWFKSHTLFLSIFCCRE